MVAAGLTSSQRQDLDITLLARVTATDPKLQVWDGLTQKYTRTRIPSRGITYSVKDLEQQARERQRKQEGPEDPTIQQLRQRGGWSPLTGYTPTQDMPPFALDPDSGPTKII